MAGQKTALWCRMHLTGHQLAHCRLLACCVIGCSGLCSWSGVVKGTQMCCLLLVLLQAHPWLLSWCSACARRLTILVEKFHGQTLMYTPLLSAGFIEYWSGSDLTHPSSAVTFKMKLDTDLFALAKAKTKALSLEVSKDGKLTAAFCADGRVRVWGFETGKLRRTYDESLEVGTDRCHEHLHDVHTKDCEQQHACSLHAPCTS